MEQSNKAIAAATFGAGCFWCVEAIFQELKGVSEVEPGYAGGHVENPSYEEVCTGNTGHAEVIRIYYDPEVIRFEKLLEVFWQVHDPTQLNRQGADVGPQYRSVVFYHDEEQKRLAEEYKRKLDASGSFDQPVVTEISPLENYCTAENFHNDYFRKNPENAFCQYVIIPKLKQFRAVFSEDLQHPED